MNFIRFIWGKIRAIIAFTGVTAIFALLFWFYGIELKAVFYPALLSFVFLLAIAVISFLRKNKKHERLMHIATLPPVGMLEELPAPETLTEEDYRVIIGKLTDELRNVITEHERKDRETSDYYSTWVHQIKTPIASMKLNLQSMDSEDARRLLRDLTSIEAYVDLVMSYLRLASEHTDYVFKKENIKELVSQTARKFKFDFIEKKLSFTLEADDAFVLTDRKWALIVLEQIVSNSLKYTEKGGVTVRYDEKTHTLVIEDTGIGIDATNLPRIFEKGFTGFNGRGEAHSSGIGLYFVKSICDNLKIGVNCESAPNEGTKMYLKFPEDRPFYE